MASGLLLLLLLGVLPMALLGGSDFVSSSRSLMASGVVREAHRRDDGEVRLVVLVSLPWFLLTR